MLLILGFGGIGIWSVEKNIKKNLAEQLQLSLSANVDALKIWTKDKITDAQVLSEQPEIQDNILSLIEISKRPDANKELFLKSAPLIWLRENLGKACKRYGFIGFIIFDNSGLQIGALRDEPVGKSHLLENSDFFYRSRQGESVISKPFAAQVLLPDIQNESQVNWPTMFTSTPVRNKKGDIVGVLAFRIRPELEFSENLRVSRFGKTGETYAFNDDGVLISNSRFDEHLKKTGLVDPDISPIFNISIRDPGRNLLLGEKISSREDISSWPLTYMAQDAIKGHTGFNVDGYNDYRGVPVVGAWTWLDNYDFGLTTEIDVDEAHRPLKVMMTWFLSLFSLLIASGIIGIFLRFRFIQSQKQIRENESQRDLILNSAGEGIYGLDLNGITTFANPSACKMLGYTQEELLGKGQHALVHHSHPDGKPYPKENCHIYSAFMDGKVHREDEEVFWRKDGSSFPVEYISKPIYDEGEIKGAVVTFTDISSRRAAEEELKFAYNKLEERIKERTHELMKAKELADLHNHAKSEFLSRMSHELRTPMNAILGFAQLMKESSKDPLPPAHLKRVSQILKAGEHLLELINEVLDLAKIESGKISISLEPVNISALVEEVITVIRPMLDQFKVNLIDNITTKKNLFVLSDQTRLKQVLLNLISNGIKYNRRDGSVTLSIKTQGEKIYIYVSDTGMGIPEQKLQNLFEPFDRLGAENSEIEGTGIGMTISKKLIESMNGSIMVTSEIGTGSEFSINLPTCEPHRNEIHKSGIPDQKFSTSNNGEEKTCSILYIEDNPANLKLVEDILSEFPEINLLSATQASLGMDLARSHKPDLILMDINLPDINGIEALKRLQNFEETYEIPVIALSANAMQKDIDQAIAAGFKKYITKPIDILKFKNMLDELLGQSHTSDLQIN